MKTQIIIEEFDDLCKELNITYCFTLGTALGIYRDGETIPGDNDIDLMVFCGKMKLQELQKRLCAMDYSFTAMNIGWGNEMNMHFWKEGILLDAHFQCLDAEDKFFEKFNEVEYHGRKYNLPYPTGEYLEMEYNEINVNKNNWKKKDSGKSRPLVGQNGKKALAINPDNYFKNKYQWGQAGDIEWDKNH